MDTIFWPSGPHPANSNVSLLLQAVMVLTVYCSYFLEHKHFALSVFHHFSKSNRTWHNKRQKNVKHSSSGWPWIVGLIGMGWVRLNGRSPI